MMHVLMLRNPRADLGCVLKEGETGDVSDSLGRELVKMGLAQEVSAKAILGVAKAPEIGKPENPTKPNPTKLDHI